MRREILVAGFGGQGVMSLGKFLVEAGMEEGLEVTWVPSYGPEMRGGTANCAVVLSDRPIGSPVIYSPTELIAMNLPATRKFQGDVAPGGAIFVNSSIVTEPITREDLRCFYVPCDHLAKELGSGKAANMVMLGAFARATGALDLEAIRRLVRRMFTGRKAGLAELNLQALTRGAEVVGGGPATQAG